MRLSESPSMPWPRQDGSGVTRASEVVSQSVQSLSRVRLFATPWTAARQASLSITNSRSPPKLTPSESVMPSYHLTGGTWGQIPA